MYFKTSDIYLKFSVYNKRIFVKQADTALISVLKV